jgi:TPR repeat protein
MGFFAYYFRMPGKVLGLGAFAAIQVILAPFANAESVMPCSPEQYYPPETQAEVVELKSRLNEDIRLTFEASERDMAMELMCRGAAAGIAEAEFILGLGSAEGAFGIDKDEKQARYWLKRAADKSHAKAQYALSILYLNARGGAMLVPAGMQLLISAARASIPDAQYELACEYVFGRYIENSTNEAIEWAQRAEKQGHRDAGDLVKKLRKYRGY